MKIFQPIITGSFSVSGSVFFPTLVTSSTVVSNVVMFGANGELFTTASSAIGGGGGVSDDYVTTASWNFMTLIHANDYIEIMWSCTNTTGQLQAQGTQTGPTRPSIPSVIATLTQIA